MDRLVSFARVLGDETRQQIMKLLCCQELSVNDIVEALSTEGNTVTQPTVSHHLGELRHANLVLVRKEGRQSFYKLNQEEIYVCCGILMVNFAPQISIDDIK